VLGGRRPAGSDRSWEDGTQAQPGGNAVPTGSGVNLPGVRPRPSDADTWATSTEGGTVKPAPCGRLYPTTTTLFAVT